MLGSRASCVAGVAEFCLKALSDTDESTALAAAEWHSAYARKCEQNGITFVGPTVENLEAFASATDYVDMIMLDYPGPDDDSIRGQWAALGLRSARKMAGGALTVCVRIGANWSVLKCDEP